MKTAQHPNVMPTDTRSRRGLRRDALAGDAQAQMVLGKIYLNGTSVRRCYKTALRWLLRAAEEKAEAGYLAVPLLKQGLGGRKNERRAFKLLLKSAELGYPPSMAALARAYYNGEDVQKDYRSAFRWAKRAHDAGEIDGTAGLGLMYCKGRGIKKNVNKGLQLMKLAADAGQANAQLDLGNIFAGGKAVRQDMHQALHYLKLATLSEDHLIRIQPLDRIWQIYLQGEGGKPNIEEALKWLNISAYSGSDAPLNKLAELYRDGIGVKADPVLAKFWELRAKEW